MSDLEARTHQYVKIYFLFHILPYSKLPMLHDAYILFLYNSARWGLCGIGKKGRGAPPGVKILVGRRHTDLSPPAAQLRSMESPYLHRPIASTLVASPYCVAISRRPIASSYCTDPPCALAPLEPLLPPLKQQGLVKSKLVLAV